MLATVVAFMVNMDWLIFLSQLPVNPSSLRVNVWRKLRASGALGLQNGVWLLPDQPEQVEFLKDLLTAIQNQGASGQIFRVAPLTESIEADIIARTRQDREEEYAELLEGTENFLAEIEKETRNQKFTFPELEEIEQDLQRLTTWLEKIQRRDFTGCQKGGEAVKALEACRSSFETFSAEVYVRQAGANGSDMDSNDQ
jgi:hypothetical protein